MPRAMSSGRRCSSRTCARNRVACAVNSRHPRSAAAFFIRLARTMTQENASRDSAFLLDGVRVPCWLYGTAWKEVQTRNLTELALRQGFRGIDTANQRRHYHEAAVGEAVAAMIDIGLVARENLFLQTKFTFRRGQDDRLPYDPQAPIATQVEQSFASSLEHLGTDRIDSYVLHGPTQR